MSRRIRVHIDKHIHINNVKFLIYRKDAGEAPVMEVSEPLAIKMPYVETMEELVRDPQTPYAFYASRHFQEVPFPKVFVGDVEVLPRDLILFPDQKMIEIHNGDLGLGDGKKAYMTYTYESMDVIDDYGDQSGVTYKGPPASALLPPINAVLEQEGDRIAIIYEPNPLESEYVYSIQAVDSDGNKSAVSLLKSIKVFADTADLYFRIEKSKDGKEWKPVAFSNMVDWHEVLEASDTPPTLNVTLTPLSSKQSAVRIQNPWHNWEEIDRHSYRFRVRAEDSAGEHTEWVELEPEVIHVRPKEILVRRKVFSGTPSSYNGSDSIDVFRITEADAKLAYIERIDDQLTEATKYSYSVFYRDELNMDAVPAFGASDHRSWANIILYRTTSKKDNILSADFKTNFELADRIIEIGTTP